MSRIDELIEQLRPKGINVVPLGEVTRLVRGQHITKDLAIPGPYPIVSASREALAHHAESNHIGNAVTISSHGAYSGFVSFWPHEIWLGNNVFLFETLNFMLPKFLFYVLKARQDEISGLAKSGGVPYINASQIQALSVPVPPLEAQHEIVRILDTFSELEAKLEAELEARKKQYEHYRNSLLTFPESEVRRIPLGEFAELIRGNGMPKSDFADSGTPAIHYGQIYTYYKTWATESKSFVPESLAKKLATVNPGDIVITNTSENIQDVGKAMVWLGQEPAVTGGHATVIRHKQNSKYLAYYFQTEEFAVSKRKYATGTKVIDVSAKNMAKILIPLPPLEKQDEIVTVLDAFELLTSDLGAGIPDEITARRKQYEYYRNQLLTFEELIA